uniref:Uncharacterized protein n=1 Tax=Pseudonaja textilis TaxID=8673 RepID=A0A670ZCG9_PSETE
MAGKSQEQSIQEELTCSICYDLFRNPVMLECMHHFCKECILKYWNGCSRIATCPQCRQTFPSRSFHPNFIVSNIVETVRRSASEEHRRKTKVSNRAMNHFPWPFEKQQYMLRLENASVRLTEEISELKKSMEQIQRRLENSEISSGLQVKLPTLPLRWGLNLGLGVQIKSTLPPSCLCNTPRFGEDQEGVGQFRGMDYLLGERCGWEEVPPPPPPPRINLQSENVCLPDLIPCVVLIAPAVLTLDPETAHPNLILSKDLTSVTERESPQAVPRSPKRFLQSVNVLARASFKSGQHYWEVWVGNKTKWELGVASDNVDRAAKVRLSPENGYWTIRLWNNSEYWAAATPWVRLEPQCLLKKVGVLLDCKAKKLTFYNAEDMSFLFTFHQLWASKFYPFFSTALLQYCLSS